MDIKFAPVDLVSLIFYLIILILVLFLIRESRPHLQRWLRILEEKFALANEISIGSFSIKAPAALSPSANPIIATKEVALEPDDKDLGELLDYGKLEGIVANYPFLMHRATPNKSTIPGQKWFAVEIWVAFTGEGEAPENKTGLLQSDISDVTYILHESFKPRVIKTADRENNFRLWLSVWGEFVIVCRVHTKGGTNYFLSRYLDLPALA